MDASRSKGADEVSALGPDTTTADWRQEFGTTSADESVRSGGDKVVMWIFPTPAPPL